MFSSFLVLVLTFFFLQVDNPVKTVDALVQLVTLLAKFIPFAEVLVLRLQGGETFIGRAAQLLAVLAELS